ncbi:class I tRNA ligase family protein [Candidatus Vidania fulgoroideorum]
MRSINKYNSRIIEKYYLRNKEKEIEIIKKQNKKEYICLSMFPYPSGRLHMGHIRNYLINDVICRYKNISSNVKSVMYFGWDAFGLPAENAAIINNISPRIWTRKNIELMKLQIKKYMFLIDWKYEINTSNSCFYKWTQYFFFKLYKNRYIYKKRYLANWDPVDKTILSDEQIIKNTGWRSGARIEKKLIKSYFVDVRRITKKLEESSHSLKWPRNVIKSQLEWIGKKSFYYCNIYYKNIKIKVFFRDIYCILGENILVTSIRNYNSFFKRDIGNYKQRPTYFKTEFRFKFKFGLKVSRPLFIIKDDNKYSKYDIFILIRTGKLSRNITRRIIYKKYKMKINIKKIVLNITKIKKTYRYKIRDWCISRQRTWGTPIPISRCIYCKKEYVYKNTIVETKISKKTYRNNNTKEVTPYICKYCNKNTYRESETLDTFFDSSWYFLIYINKGNLNIKKLKHQQYMNIYIGGVEHSILHLIYVRIFFIILKRLGVINKAEPIRKLITQGMVLTIINGKRTKMSKSIGGNIDPKDLVKKYGLDCVRMYILFSGPIEKDMLWDDSKINGSLRYIKKLWSFFIYKLNKVVKIRKKESKKLEETKKEIRNFYISNRFNKVISKTMEMFKIIKRKIKIKNYSNISYYYDIILALYPICPCFTSVIWKLSGKEKQLGYIYTQKISNKYKRKIVKIYINGELKEKIIRERETNYYKYKYINKYKLENIKRTIVKDGIINFLVNEN